MRATVVFILSLISLPLARAQSCSAHALNLIHLSVQKAASGDTKSTQSLLDEAEQDCPTSAAVMRQLARVYRDVLMDTAKADALVARAQALDGEHFTTVTQAATLTATNSVVRDKWALVLGVSKFKNMPEAGLQCPAKDAHDFAQALIDPHIGRFHDDGSHVHVLTDEQATLQNLMSEIDYISHHAGVDDLVVLYISSHGTSASSDRTASGDAQTGYVVTYDTNPKNLFSTAFAMENLKKVLDHLKAKRVVVFLDTCFSGDTFRWVQGQKGAKGLAVIEDTAYERVVQGTGRVLIVSSSGSQQSWEGTKNSFFTESLIAAMKQNNGMSTVSQLFATLEHDLPYAVKKAKQADQTPLMWPSGQNVNIVLGSPVE